MKRVILLWALVTWNLLAIAQQFEPGVVKVRALSEQAIPETDLQGGNYTFTEPVLQQFFDDFDSVTFKQAMPSIKHFMQYPEAEDLAMVYEIRCDCDEEVLWQQLKTDLSNWYTWVERKPTYIPTYTPNDYSRNGSGSLSELDLIRAPEAWDITKGNPDIKIAIFDLGFNDTHEDLADNVVFHDSPTSTGHEHGTRVAGVAGAVSDNGKGMASAGFNAPLILYNLVGLSEENILQAVSQGARVFNFSFAGSASSESVQQLINMLHREGIIFVAAAGNGGCWEYKFTKAPDELTCSEKIQWLANRPNEPQTINGVPIGSGEIPFYPASYEHVITVSSVGHLFNRNSSHADNWKDVHEHIIGDVRSAHSRTADVDVCAPGYNIFVPDGNNQYTSGDGTSYASPMTASVCALILSANPCLNAQEVEDILKSTAVDIYGIPENAPYIGKLGVGRIDAYAAVNLAQSFGMPATTIASGHTVVWTDEKLLLGDIVVEPGAHLTIEGTVRMPENGRIIVQRGGVLTVKGGTLTTTCLNTMWQGIEVWGTPGISQQQPGAQGLVQLQEGALIEHARIGISTSRKDNQGFVWSHTGGGVIQAFNSTFRNNLRAIEFMGFHNPLNPSGTEPNNLSVFEQCVFETNNWLKDPIYTINEHRIAAPALVSLSDVYGVRFRGCTFANRDLTHQLFPYDIVEERSYKGTGLFSVDADYRVEPWVDNTCVGCPPQPTVFENLAGGVEAYTSNGLRHVTVKGCSFHNVSRGIQIVGGSHDRIEDNTFLLDDGFEHTQKSYEGIVLSHCDGYRVTDNYLERNTGPGFSVNTYGIRVDTSGSFAGEVYRNTLTTPQWNGFEYALWTEGDNAGLKLECNTFDYSFRDWVSHELDKWSKPATPQGLCNPALQTERISAGNNFDYTCSAEQHIRFTPNPVNNKHDNIEYIYNRTEVRNPQQTCVTTTMVNTHTCGNQADPHPCLPLSNPSGGTLLLDRAELINDLQNRLLTIDGGQTPTLLAYLQDAGIGSLALRDTLIGYSPYLSDEVLIASIERLPIMANLDLYEVLRLNQPLTEDVWSVLLQRSPALPDSLESLLAAGQSGLSDRQLLEGAIAYGQRDLQLNMASLLRHYMEQGRPDSLQWILETDTNPSSTWRLARLYSETGQYTRTSQLIDTWTSGTVEDQAMAELEQTFQALTSAGKNWHQLSSGQKTQLYTLAQGQTHAGVLAQAVLTLVDSARFWRPAPQLQEQQAMISPTVGLSEEHVKTQAQLTARPNPFGATTRLEYSLASELKGNFSIEIYDLSSGQVLQQHPVKSETGYLILDGNQLKPGVLLAVLKQNNTSLVSVKLVHQP